MTRKRVRIITLLAACLLSLAGFAHAQPLTQTITLDGFTMDLPASWVAEPVPSTGIGIASGEGIIERVDQSQDPLAAGETAILIIEPQELQAIVGSSASPREVLDIFLGFLNSSAQVSEVRGMPFEALFAEVSSDEFPGGRALLYSLDLNGYPALAAVVSGDELRRVRPEVEAILATLTYEPPARPESVGAMTYGDEVSGKVEDGGMAETWTFEGLAGDVVTITLVADSRSSLDPVVNLYTLEGYENADAPIASNDDSSNPALNVFDSEIEAFALPEDGTYVIEAKGFGSIGGAYILTLALADAQSTPQDAASDGGVIAYGDTVTGSLSDDTPEQLWMFEGLAGDIVTITMIAEDSNALDPRLYLFAEGRTSTFDELAENDDAEDSSIGRRNAQIVAFELPADGNYIIEATRFGSGAGRYTLTLESAAGGKNTASTDEALRQWAADATGSSQYGSSSWSFAQATGEPNTTSCGDISTAWASSSSNGRDFLTLFYEVPVVPTQISIYQTYNPGSIIRVEVSNSQTEDMLELPDSADPPGNTECPGVFTLDISDVDFAIDTVTIFLDQTIGGGWNEIDAVELVGVAE
jgi:hypothetical protein